MGSIKNPYKTHTGIKKQPILRDNKLQQATIRENSSYIIGKDEVTSSNLVSSSRKHLKSSDFGCFSLQKCTFRYGSKCGSTA